MKQTERLTVQWAQTPTTPAMSAFLKYELNKDTHVSNLAEEKTYKKFQTSITAYQGISSSYVSNTLSMSVCHRLGSLFIYLPYVLHHHTSSMCKDI